MKAGWLIVALFLATVGGIAVAQTNYNDTVNCRWKDGRDMNARDCEFFRQRKASDEAEEAAHQARLQARLAKQQEEREKQEQAKVERNTKEAVRAAEIKREYDQQQAEYWQAVQEGKRRREAEEAAQKKKCGKDFGKLRVGMTLGRYEECTDGVIFMTETVSKGAVVETYRSTFYFIHARDGLIVAFTRR